MTRKTKILIGVSALAFAAMGTIAVGASAHDRFREGHGRHFGGSGMHGPHMFAERADKMFDRFDTDKDGKVTQAEVDAVRAQDIKKFDANGDGVLQLDEYQNLWLEHMRSRMVDSFQRLDDDGDGKVTDAEMKAPMARMTRFMDRDGDGSVTREEMRPRRHHYRDDDDRGPHREMRGMDRDRN
jgi:Ca2+-binding EF-hand superfamily protein